MIARRALILTACIILCQGCALFRDGTDLIWYKMRESASDCRERARNRRWAETAWQEASRRGGPYSVDHALGFKEGFADYLYRGGLGEPPLIPPNRYRALRYQTAQGCLATQDWFAGFRHGAATVRDGGYRQWVTGVSSLGVAAALPGPIPLPAPSPASPPYLPATIGPPVAQPELPDPLLPEPTEGHDAISP